MTGLGWLVLVALVAALLMGRGFGTEESDRAE